MVHIDLITGFLGAGKTTFANILMQEYISRNEKVVYIVNEFGRTSLDAELMRREGFNAAALSNGCVCCSLKNDLTEAFKEVILTFLPTKIVFETSGIFIFNGFEEFLKDDFLREHCKISRTITIVDSINYKQGMLAAGSFLYNQVKNSSELIISKLERFSGDISGIVHDLGQVNPDAAILALPWNDKNFMERVLAVPEGGLRNLSSGDKHALMDSLTIVSFKDFTNESYIELKDRILSEDFGRVFRVKGTIKIEGEIYFLNIAMGDVVLKKAFQGAKPILTFIGENINTELLRRIFEN